MGYRRQVNRKTLEGCRNPDRDAQFEHINAAAIAAQVAGRPAGGELTRYLPRSVVERGDKASFIQGGSAAPAGGELIPNMPEHRLMPLREKFADAMANAGVFMPAIAIAE